MNFYQFLQIFTNSYTFLQISTNFYKFLQISTNFYKFLQISTNFYDQDVQKSDSIIEEKVYPFLTDKSYAMDFYKFQQIWLSPGFDESSTKSLEPVAIFNFLTDADERRIFSRRARKGQQNECGWEPDGCNWNQRVPLS